MGLQILLQTNLRIAQSLLIVSRNSAKVRKSYIVHTITVFLI